MLVIAVIAVAAGIGYRGLQHLHVVGLVGRMASDSKPERLRAQSALQDIGQRAIPQLLAALRAPDEHTRLGAHVVLSELGAEAAPSLFAAIAIETDSEVLERQLSALEWMCSDDVGTERTVPLALLPMFAEGRPTLVAVLRHRAHAPGPRARAAGLLGAMPDAADPAALSALIEAIDDPALEVRLQATTAVGRMGPWASAAAPHLARLLGTGRTQSERLAAVQSLSRLGSAGEVALPELYAALRDNLHSEVATAAYALFVRLGRGNDPELMAVLADAATDPEPTSTYTAMERLASMGKTALPELVKLSASEDSRRRVKVTEMLEVLGEKTDGVAAPLLALTRDAFWEVRYHATIAFVALYRATRIGPDDRVPAITALLELIAAIDVDSEENRKTGTSSHAWDMRDRLRPIAVQALADIGRPDMGGLIQVAAAGQSPTLGAALDALVCIGEPAVALLVASLDAAPDPTGPMLALGAIGPAAARAAEPLRRVLDDPACKHRHVAAYALGGLGQHAAPAVPSLCTALRDTDPKLRRHAANALGRIGDTSPATLGALRACLRDPEEAFRLEAKNALEQLEGPGDR